MYKLEAYLRPSALEEVQKALGALGIAGMSVTEIRGFGRQRGHREVYRGAEYRIDFVPKVKVEVIVRPADRDPAVDAIGSLGNGVYTTDTDPMVVVLGVNLSREDYFASYLLNPDQETNFLIFGKSF